MTSVATELKSEREKRKISLEQISAETNISRRHLENLEEGRYNELPGGIYNRAFLRAYCKSIHLDQRALIERYEAEVAPDFESVPQKIAPVGLATGSMWLRPVVIWSLMLVLSATALFFTRSWIAEIFSPYFSRASVSTAPYEAPENPSGDGAPSAKSPSFPAYLSSLPPDLPSDIPGNVVEILPASDVSESPPAGFESLRLELSATEQCWISIDRDGSPAVRKVLEPGEVQSLDAFERFYIILGNAGGVHLKINGVPVRQLGKSGEVLRLQISEKELPNLLDQSTG